MHRKLWLKSSVEEHQYRGSLLDKQPRLNILCSKCSRSARQMKRCLNERGSRSEPPLLVIPLRKPKFLKGSEGLLMALQQPVRTKCILEKSFVLRAIEWKHVCNNIHKALLNSARRSTAYLFFQPPIAFCLEA